MAARAAEPGQPPTWASSRHSLDSPATCRTLGGRQGPVHGYATRAERYAKQRRLQRLETELVEVEDRLRGGRVSGCRGGRRQARLRHNLDRIGVDLAESEWRARWQAKAMRPPTLAELRQSRTIGVDPNAEHLPAGLWMRSGTPSVHLTPFPLS